MPKGYPAPKVRWQRVEPLREQHRRGELRYDPRAVAVSMLLWADTHYPLRGVRRATGRMRTRAEQAVRDRQTAAWRWGEQLIGWDRWGR